MSAVSSFKIIENKNDAYRGKDWMKNFCESLREHTLEIINFKKKKIKLWTNEHQKSYENAKICYVCKEKFEDKHAKDKKYQKVKDHCHYIGEYRGAAEISIVFHNVSNYDYYFIITELAEKCEKQFTYLGENTDKYIIFSVLI